MEKHGVLKRNSLDHNHNHIKWDEETIKEQDKHRGTYEKITQPKTPRAQRVSVHSDKKIIQVETEEDAAIEKHLEQAELNANRNQTKKPDIAKLNAQLIKKHEEPNVPQEHTTEQQRLKHEQFLKKRAEHYSQFKKIQQAKKHLHDQQQ